MPTGSYFKTEIIWKRYLYNILISLNDGDKYDLQVMQNDSLRYCKDIGMLDKVSIAKIHDSVHVSLLSLEQRRQKQLLNIMFIQASNGKARAITNINTRSQNKYVFKVPTKVGHKYQKSSYFLGKRLWESLDKTTQDLPCRYAFKKHIDSLYKKYNPLLWCELRWVTCIKICVRSKLKMSMNV